MIVTGIPPRMTVRACGAHSAMRRRYGMVLTGTSGCRVDFRHRSPPQHGAGQAQQVVQRSRHVDPEQDHGQGRQTQGRQVADRPAAGGCTGASGRPNTIREWWYMMAQKEIPTNSTSSPTARY